jgi:hypothetical protein
MNDNGGGWPVWLILLLGAAGIALAFALISWLAPVVFDCPPFDLAHPTACSEIVRNNGLAVAGLFAGLVGSGTTFAKAAVYPRASIPSFQRCQIRWRKLGMLRAYRQNCCPASRHMYQCQESICAPLTLIAGYPFRSDRPMFA